MVRFAVQFHQARPQFFPARLEFLAHLTVPLSCLRGDGKSAPAAFTVVFFAFVSNKAGCHRHTDQSTRAERYTTFVNCGPSTTHSTQ